MERIISDEERLRRAEIISLRRQNRINAKNIHDEATYSKNEEKRKISFLAKISIKIITSICLFGLLFYDSQNGKMIINKIEPYINNDTDFSYIYNVISTNINKIFEESSNINEVSSNEINQEENVASTNETQNNNSNEVSNNEEKEKENVIETSEATVEKDNQEQQAGVGGGDEETKASTEEVDDVTYIKNKLSFIKPVKNGYITSHYGKREKTDIVSENHKGVDIGASLGEDILASTSGTVKSVSSYGDYGNHIEIVNGEISTLYAHCSELLVTEGESVKQGQVIAKVGSTGKSTGPHLHFEIRRNELSVNPEEILEL